MTEVSCFPDLRSQLGGQSARGRHDEAGHLREPFFPQPKDWRGHAERSDNLALMIEDGSADAAKPCFELLIVYRIAGSADAQQLEFDRRWLHDGVRRISLQRQLGDEIVARVFGQERQHGFSSRCAVNQGLLSRSRQRLQAPPAFDVRDRQHVDAAQDGHVRAFAGLACQRSQKRDGPFAELQSGDGTIAELDQARPKAVGSLGASLDEAIVLEHNQQPVNGALVQLKLSGDVCGGEVDVRIGHALQHGNGAIEDLYPVTRGGRVGAKQFGASEGGFWHGALNQNPKRNPSRHSRSSY